LVETLEQAHTVEVPDPRRVAYVTQTLSIDETAEIIAALHERFPTIMGPQKEDICYATTNRQRAVKELLPEIDLLLVIGSSSSSNSTRLVETARAGDVAAYMIEDESGIDETWLEGFDTVGLTSGASAPEKLLVGVCDWFRARGVTEIRPVRFALRRRLVQAPGRTESRGGTYGGLDDPGRPSVSACISRRALGGQSPPSPVGCAN